MRWVTGWAVNATDEQAIALLPAKVWTTALRQDGKVHEIKGPDGDMGSYQVAQLTCLRDLTGRPTPLPWSRRGRGLRESDKTGQPRAAALEVLAA